MSPVRFLVVPQKTLERNPFKGSSFLTPYPKKQKVIGGGLWKNTGGLKQKHKKQPFSDASASHLSLVLWHV